MSLCRNFQSPVTSSITRIVGRRSSFGPCLRSFSSTRQASQSSKRELQTATAYKPHTFSTPFPPRNAGTPDTSISVAIPGLDTPQHAQHPQAPTSSSEQSLPEREAQKSEPVVKNTEAQESTTTTTPSSRKQTSSKPRRSKLRPRKAALSLTPTAISHLRELLAQPDPKMIRIGVKNRGCSGLAYHLEYVEKPGAFDEVVEQDDVKVLVDSKALFSIIGSEMDWQEDKLSSRFVFKNPNIKDECGCGESFMV